jgi:hypothetical protein
MFSAEEIRQLLDKASAQVKAAILLGDSHLHIRSGLWL